MGAGCSSAPKHEYKIITTTSDLFEKGATNNTVRLRLLNEEDATDWVPLDNFFRNDFKKGNVDTFKTHFKEFVIPTAVKLEVEDYDKDSPWLCDHVHVHKAGKIYEFPAYDWIQMPTIILSGKVRLSFHDLNGFERDTIKREIERNKGRFGWVARACEGEMGWDLPRFVNDSEYMPLIFQRPDKRDKEFKLNAIKAVLDQSVEFITGIFSKLDEYDDYMELSKALFPDYPDPQYLNTWKTDEEFGRQQLNGISPLSFKRCDALPKGCMIRDEHLKNLLDHSLETEMQHERLFIADYSSMFQGVKRNSYQDKVLYCPDALCLYTVNKDQNLVPICIQLEPNNEESIFTPNDTPDDWKLAKMYFKVPMSNYHEWYVHFLATHGCMEPVAVALFRCLPKCHPLYKLLRQHVDTVTAINANARSALIPQSSLANTAMAIAAEDFSKNRFRHFNWNDLVIPEVIKKNGLDSKYLTKFFYRDDALTHWEAQENYMRSVLELYYKSDDDVCKDEQLQDFVSDLGNEGFGWQDGNKHGIPDKFRTLQEVVTFATTVMFTSSVQHAAVNFPQFEYYKFIPNFAAAMRLPIHKKGEATMERIFASLPDKIMSSIMITLTYTLSAYSKEEEYIGSFKMKLFEEEGPLKCQNDYKLALNKINEKLIMRNQEGEAGYQYEHLLPGRIPNSIAI